MPTIHPALLFDGDAEEALEYYSSIFENAVVSDLNRYADNAPYPSGTLLAATLTLEGLSFTLINGPDVPFTDAVSFMVSVDGQDEIDRYWNALTAEGEETGAAGCATSGVWPGRSSRSSSQRSSGGSIPRRHRRRCRRC